MPQVALPFNYGIEKTSSGLTAYAGLPIYLDLLHRMRFLESVEQHVGAHRDGKWSDSQLVMALLLLNLVGGDCVDDLKRLEADDGLRTLLFRLDHHHLPRFKRRELERRWRKSRARGVPSPSTMRRYLGCFHDEGQEKLREQGKAFIPEANQYLLGLRRVMRDLLAFAQLQKPERTVTLDEDATCCETTKKEALYCYKGFKAYQPLNVWWAEKELVVHTEFRDGNVPAGYENLRVLIEALEMLPDRVEKVRFRADTAAYQWELLRYCEEGKNERFGRIEFAVGCDVSPEFKAAVKEIPEEAWIPIYEYLEDGTRRETHRERALVDFVPGELASTKKGDYRFLATRELLEQQPLSVAMEQPKLPFQTVDFGPRRYKLHGLVTNLREEDGWDAEDVILWLDKRCGKSEEAHDVMKRDLAGGMLPSKDFGANAAWWWGMILALNVNSLLKSLVLGERWMKRRMKAIRLHVINVAGRVAEPGRRLTVYVAGKLEEFFQDARRRIAELFSPSLEASWAAG